MLNFDDPTFRRLPDHTKRGLAGWILLGRPPGYFLTQVLLGKLHEAVRAADEQNRSLLPEISDWLYQEAPSPSFGSLALVEMWPTERHRYLPMCGGDRALIVARERGWLE